MLIFGQWESKMTNEIKQLLTVAGLLLLKLVLIIGLFVWLTGCANTQMVENMKRENEWRSQVAEDVKREIKQEKDEFKGTVLLEVPADLYAPSTIAEAIKHGN